ncbi:procathepsin L-like [Harmonia axyridis]|uniref:procathepsin L-like n=1 Tax=Harmonia axyridis TaxID=115357 RepID=UPI001E279C09|nr:procathepsin L-like [Harmonia axyridis]
MWIAIMKVLALICLVVIGCVNAISDEEVLQKWESYQVEFGKSYRSPVEARKRLAIFKENLEEIEVHNALFEQGKSTYTKGINQFTDWTKEEFMQYVNKGVLNKPVIVGEIYNASKSFSNVGSVDWRSAGVVTPVKNQGQCGSCWSFSATGAIEGQLGRNGYLTSLSEQNLIDCSTSYGNYGCNGGLMTAAFSYVIQNGIQSEQDYPYIAMGAYCQADSSRIVTKLSSYMNVASGSDAALQQAITEIGPVSVAIDATNALQSYSGGVFNDYSCNSQSLNHGVLAVGYGTENGETYYIVKNSWGANWGEAGYFRLGMNTYNPCGIASMASFPVL